MMQPLYPLGDIDLLDAYHLCEGRVVTYRTYGAGWSNSVSSAGVEIGARERGFASGSSGCRSRWEPGVSTDLSSFRDTDSVDYCGGTGARDRTTGLATPTEGEKGVRVEQNRCPQLVYQVHFKRYCTAVSKAYQRGKIWTGTRSNTACVFDVSRGLHCTY